MQIKRNKRNVLLLTSCVEPIIKKNISNISIANNLKDINKNIENLFNKFPEINKHYEIFLVDCSRNFNINFNNFEFLKENPKYKNQIKFIKIDFKEEEYNNISLRGKGYSELLLLENSIRILNLKNEDIIHKLSARYCLKFPKFVLGYNSRNIYKYLISITYSNIFKRTITHYFCIKTFQINNLIQYCKKIVNDYNHTDYKNILEKVIFRYLKNKNCISRKDIKKSIIFPYYKSVIQPGSSLIKRSSSKYAYQILRQLVILI